MTTSHLLEEDLPMFGTGQHLVSVSQFDRQNLNKVFDLAETLRPIAEREQICTVLDGAVLCSLFFEPSTRTRLSFESAFLRLGGEVETTTGFTFSSMAKGESIADTARVVSGYTDVLVVRHPDDGSVAEFARHSRVPVLNAGDGSGEHPSQALLDAFTMEKELKKRGRDSLDGATVAILGDLKLGRTVHSLIKLLSLYEGVTFKLFCPKSLELPVDIREYAQAHGSKVIDCESQIQALRGSDVVYCTRVQRERMSEEAAKASELKGCLLNRAMLEEAGALDIIICHPLPRDSRPNSLDLSTDVDELPGLSIFRQTDNGVLVRMALFLTALGVTKELIAAKTKQKGWRVTAE